MFTFNPAAVKSVVVESPNTNIGNILKEAAEHVGYTINVRHNECGGDDLLLKGGSDHRFIIFCARHATLEGPKWCIGGYVPGDKEDCFCDWLSADDELSYLEARQFIAHAREYTGDTAWMRSRRAAVADNNRDDLWM